jgi:hypothetical protein
MIVSLNEIETTILKAARGAGLAWGLAEEAAQAARWLAARRLAFEAAFVFVLESEAWRSDVAVDDHALGPRGAGGRLCPIRAGAWLSDLGDKLPLRVERALCPLLLAPFAARRHAPVELAWEDVTIRFDPSGAAWSSRPLSDSYVARAASAELRRSSGSAAGWSALEPRDGGLQIEVPEWERLQRFAARTYVQASLESRLSGAGAGLSEND